MTTPQQPELRRSGHTDVTLDRTKPLVDDPAGTHPTERGESGPVPPANRPGHHPEVEQDKPTGVPTAYRRPDDATDVTGAADADA